MVQPGPVVIVDLWDGFFLPCLCTYSGYENGLTYQLFIWTDGPHQAWYLFIIFFFIINKYIHVVELYDFIHALPIDIYTHIYIYMYIFLNIPDLIYI